MTFRRLPALGALVLVGLTSTTPDALGQTLTPGGLSSLPGIYRLGPNLATNGDFELSNGAKPTSWTTDAAWSVDATAPRSGAFSLRLTDAPSVPFAQIARQTLTLRKGIYKLSGYIRTQDLGANTAGSGVRLNLDYSVNGTLMRGLTPVVSGTTDWTYFEKTNIVVPDDRTAVLKLEAYREPSGSAWFDDVRVEEQLPAPVEVFLLYPNYRGMLFDDQSQTIRLDVAVSPPADGAGPYDVVATLRDGTTVIATRTYPASPALVAELDGSGMVNGRRYDVEVALIDRSIGGPVYTAPAYRVSRVPASARLTMNVAFDEQNRVLLQGTPRFVLGVYDSGFGYGTTDAFWEDALWSPTGSRRMDGLRINVYLNYWFGQASTTAMNALMTNLQKRGVMYLQPGNCFQTTPASTQNFTIDTSDDYVRTLGAHAGSAGYYTADECINELVPGAFTQYGRLMSLDPDKMTFAALLGTPPDVFMWSDTADVISTDPYPLYAAEPATGYPHDKVAEWTRIARDAVLNARPFMTVLQFFKFTSSGRWPTKAEMWSHVQMAVVEGARGLFWWSLGTNALRDVCSDWCAERTLYMENLKTVVGNTADLEPALLAPDTPASLTSASPTTIRTKVKTVGQTAYVFAYNAANTATSATFTWHTVLGSVTVHGENRTVAPSGNQFTDTFGPYEGHAYVIAPAPVPPQAPTTLVATAAGSSRIDLAWTDNASTEETFRIERATGSGAFAEVATVGVNVTTYSDTGLAEATAYSYRVRASNLAGASSYSNTATATTAATVPAPPSGLTAALTSPSRIDLAWTDASGNETGFTVERSTNGGAFGLVATVGVNATAYADTSLPPATTYSYRIRAFNTAGPSAYSNTATVTVTVSPPAAPSNLTAGATAGPRVNLSWTDNASNESGVTIFRSANKKNTFTQIGTTGPNATTFVDTTVAPNTLYYYRVRTFNSAGTSAYSNTTSVRTPAQ